MFCSSCGLNWFGDQCDTYCEPNETCGGNGFCVPEREKDKNGVTIIPMSTKLYGSEGSRYGLSGNPGTCVCFDGYQGSGCNVTDQSIFQSTLCPFPAGMQYAYLKVSNNYENYHGSLSAGWDNYTADSPDSDFRLPDFGYSMADKQIELSFALNATSRNPRLTFTQLFESTQIEPNSGATGGGTFVKISGRGFGFRYYPKNHSPAEYRDWVPLEVL
jgi:hypothetical protein